MTAGLEHRAQVSSCMVRPGVLIAEDFHTSSEAIFLCHGLGREESLAKHGQKVVEFEVLALIPCTAELLTIAAYSVRRASLSCVKRLVGERKGTHTISGSRVGTLVDVGGTHVKCLMGVGHDSWWSENASVSLRQQWPWLMPQCLA